jgi:hypothetical protein
MCMKKDNPIPDWTARYCVDCNAYHHLNIHGQCSVCGSDAILPLILVKKRKVLS